MCRNLRAPVVVLLVCALGTGFARADADLDRGKFLAEVEQAKAELELAKQKLAEQQKLTDAQQLLADAASAEVARCAALRSDVDNRIAAAKTDDGARTAHLEKLQAELQAEIKELDAKIEASKDPFERKQLREQRLSLGLSFAQLEKQRQRELAKLKTDEKVAALQKEYQAATDQYWDARKKAAPVLTQLSLERSALARRERAVGDASDRLADLMLKAPEALAGLVPPHLQRLQVIQGSKVVYDASWVDRESEAEQNLYWFNRLVEAQRKAVDDFDAARGQMLQELVRVDAEWHEVHNEYITRLEQELWARIGMECGDAAASVLWSKKPSWGLNLAFEAVWRVGKAFFGDSPHYDFPKIKGDPQAETVAAQASQIAGAIWKKKNMTIVKAAAKNTVKALVDKKEPVIEMVKAYGIWSVVQAGAMSDVMKIGGVTEQESALLMTTLRDVATARRRAAYDALKGAIFSKKFAADMGKSLGKSALRAVAVESGKAFLESRRGESWYKMYLKDLEYRSVLAELRSASGQWSDEVQKLNAVVELRDEALAELRASRFDRRLKRVTDEIALPERTSTVKLTFSRPVKDLKVTFAGTDIPATGKTGTDFELEFVAKPDGFNGSFEIDAIDEVSAKPIDGRAESKVVCFSETEFTGYEKESDRAHRIRFSESLPGASIVLLIDCSGSMSDNDRISQAKAAATKLLADPKTVRADDEVALWIFVSGTPRMLVPFTTDMKKVASAVNALGTDGGTPLAESIMEAGTYLVNRGNKSAKVLIVLSDGEQAPDAVADAIRRVQRLDVTIRKEGW